MSKLDELGASEVTISFSTSELLKLFGLPSPDDLDPVGAESTPLDQHSYLNIEKGENEETGEPEGLFDVNDKQIPDEAIERLEEADRFATESGTQGKYSKSIITSLENLIEYFSDLSYEYPYLTEDGHEEYKTGKAKGVVSASVDLETTTITTNTDLAHLINDCIAGVGRFSVDDDLEGNTIEEWIKSRFHWLKERWHVYGERKPSISLSVDYSFDKNYFAEMVTEIEKEFDIDVLAKSLKKESSLSKVAISLNILADEGVDTAILQNKIIEGLNKRFKNQEDFEMRMDTYAEEVAKELGASYDRDGDELIYSFGSAKLLKDPSETLKKQKQSSIISNFQKDAEILGRDKNSVKELELWLKADISYDSKYTDEDEEFYEGVSVKDYVTYILGNNVFITPQSVRYYKGLTGLNPHGIDDKIWNKYWKLINEDTVFN